MGLNILYGIGIAAIFGLAVFLEWSGVLSLAYVLGVLLFVFDLFGPLKALYGEASRLTVMNAALDLSLIHICHFTSAVCAAFSLGALWE